MFMGVAQILLDNLDLSELVIGWYKLFGTSSLVSVPPGGGKESAQVKYKSPQVSDIFSVPNLHRLFQIVLVLSLYVGKFRINPI